MTITTATRTGPQVTEDWIVDAAGKLYDAEVALHIARQSGVDRWVAAAYDRLHEAVLAYEFALGAHG